MPRRRLFPTLGALAALVLALGAAERPPDTKATIPPTTAEVTVTLVQIEVRVEDKKGNFISALGLNDFKLLEDGVAQKLEFVDEVTTPRSETARRPAPSPTPPTATAPIEPRKTLAAEPSTVIVVVDRANSSSEAIRRQRKYLDGFFAGLEGTGTIVAVFEIKPDGGFEMLSRFAADLAPARRAVERLAAGVGGSTDRRGKTDELEGILEQKLSQCARQPGDSDSPCREAAFRGLTHAATLFAQEQRSRGVATLESLRSILRFADHLPGSRQLVLVSEGIDPGGVSYFNTAAQLMRYYSQTSRSADTQRFISELQREVGLYASETPRIQDLTRLAIAANVTVHWVNPSSGDEKMLSAEEQLGNYTANLEIAEAAEPPRLMKGLADDTGGLALPRAVGLDEFFARLGRDVNSYYVLSYTPSRRYRDGAEHRVEVQSLRPGARVRMRRTYVDQLPQERLQRTLAAALDFPEMFAAFPVTASLAFLKKDATYHVQVRLAVPYAEISPESHGDRVLDTLHFGWVARTPAGELVKTGAPSIPFNHGNEEYARLVAGHAQLDYGFGLDLPPGKYALVTAVLDASDLRSATRQFDLDLPAPGRSCLAVTPLMLAQSVATAPERVAELSFDPDGRARWQDLSLSFATSPALAATGKLTGIYQILSPRVSPNGTADVQIYFRLYQGKNFINQTPPTHFDRPTDVPNQSITNVFAVPYSRLSPGDYRLDLVAHDNTSGCDAVGSAAFVIVPSTASPPAAGGTGAESGREE